MYQYQNDYSNATKLFMIVNVFPRTVVNIFPLYQEAAKRCKATFLSSPDDKKLRWIISEDSPLPKLISEHTSEDTEQVTTPTNEEASQVPVIDDVAEQKYPQETTSSSAKGRPRSGRGRRGRAKGDKVGIRLISLEQEMIEWASGGFLPSGKEGLVPAVEEEIQVQVIPVEARSNEERGQDDSASRRKQKVMVLQVRSKGRVCMRPSTIWCSN